MQPYCVCVFCVFFLHHPKWGSNNRNKALLDASRMGYRWPYPVTRGDGHDDFTDFIRKKHMAVWFPVFFWFKTLGSLNIKEPWAMVYVFFLGGFHPSQKKQWGMQNSPVIQLVFFTKVLMMPWASMGPWGSEGRSLKYGCHGFKESSPIKYPLVN